MRETDPGKPILATAFLVCLALAGQLATAEAPPGVYVILDGSGSMWGQLPDGTHKITAARDVVQRFRADAFAGREVAFRVYGHRREGDCSDTELIVPFSPPAAALEAMATFADSVNPKGKTPITRSLRAALQDFGDRAGEIVLISDGIETCDADPCALVREWREKNVAIKVHVVGLGLEEKESAAMTCISEAAGTEYHDAQSADELAAGLEKIREASGSAGLGPEPSWRALDIVGATAAGKTMRIVGTAVAVDGGEELSLTSNGHNLLPPGDYLITVGVRTRNGNLYEPVSRKVTVKNDPGEQEERFTVAEPPSVGARFLEAGAERTGSLVTAFQDDQEVLAFRPMDRAYVDPGTYEFRSRPDADNALSVSETLAPGDHKEIVFELVQTVKAIIKMVAAGSGIDFRSNYELWQEGEMRYKVHWSNGVRALPGTYDLHLPLRLTPYVHRGLTLTTEERQEHRVEVPVGHVTVLYQKADGSRDEDERCFLERDDGGRWVRDGVSRTGETIPLVPGSYRVEGWSAMGEYEPVQFDLAVGDQLEIVLRDRSGE